MKTKKEILEELKPKNINFIVDVFEDLILQDISISDDSIKLKLHRDLTKYFNDWIKKKLKAKEQVKVNIKGDVRSGKSLVGLKITSTTTKNYENKIFNIEKIVCANQKELRKKLNKCDFGDSFLIDENVFANVGAGSITEFQQLKDINNIIAKNNNHMIYITPQVFLKTGATLGLSYYGKDVNNWLSRFLLYSLKNNMPILLGYVIFDIGALFIDNGCLIFKKTGGCTNPNRLKIENIDKNYIKYSSCIPEKYDSKNLINDEKQCPFYNICTSQMCKYEHKKDKWIEKEMKGGLGDREAERYEIALTLLKKLVVTYNEENEKYMLDAKNGKELKLKIKLRMPMLSNAKFTGVEIEEIQQLVMLLTSKSFIKEICNSLELDYDKEIEEIEKNI